MDADIATTFEEVESRICKLQKTNVSQKEKLRNYEYEHKQTQKSYILRIIDIIDMLESIRKNINLDIEENSNAALIIKKISKKAWAFS